MPVPASADGAYGRAMTAATVTREPLVSDVMTRQPVTVGPEESLFAAWSLLSSGDVHHLPVVSDGRCLAVLDDRTVAAAVMSAPTLRSRRVADVMPPRVHCVLPGTTLRRAAGIMAMEHATAVPVVDGTLRLVGLVTHRDVVAAVARYGLGQAGG